ncbi:MAG: hypothetical protein AB7R55_14755 [Gemmatimonadales bacterium]
MPKLAREDRLLAAPPPRPRVIWRYSVVTDQVLTEGRACTFRKNGLRLRYSGPTRWSQSHHLYLVFLTRDLRRRSRLDPVGIALELAERIGVHPSDVECKIGSLAWPPAPPGLCSWCWRAGKRAHGTLGVRHATSVSGKPLVWTLYYCPDHLEDHAERFGVVAVP